MSDDELALMRRWKVGFVFQSFFLLPELTVLENVMLALTYHGIEKREQIKKAELAIEKVGLTHRRDYNVTKISGGEKQRTAIARALVAEPKVIFADEPTGNLDSKSGAIVMEVIERLNKEGSTILLVTHETDTAKHAKRIIRLKDGQITEDTKVKKRSRSRNGAGLNK